SDRTGPARERASPRVASASTVTHVPGTSPGTVTVRESGSCDVPGTRVARASMSQCERIPSPGPGTRFTRAAMGRCAPIPRPLSANTRRPARDAGPSSHSGRVGDSPTRAERPARLLLDLERPVHDRHMRVADVLVGALLQRQLPRDLLHRAHRGLLV